MVRYNATNNSVSIQPAVAYSKPVRLNTINELKSSIEAGIAPSQNDLKRLMRECELNGSFLAVSNACDFKIHNIRMKFFRAAASFKEKEFVYHYTYEGVRVFRIK